eukprot:scaffold4418_cov130-Skeletonema_marinoi.AAC.9
MIVLTKALASLLPSSKKIAAAACLSSHAVPHPNPPKPKRFNCFATDPDLVPVYHLKKEVDTQPSLTSISSDVHQPRDVAEDIHETTLRQCLDLFKHAHVKASYRCMKRGDDEFSREYSLGISINAHIPNKESNKRVLADTPSLVDRRDWRKRMHNTFWEAYSSRKDRIA